MTDLIAYYRVSTTKQGAGGLGIDAQRTAVEGYAQANAAKIVASYTEVESGRVDERPQLAQAIRHAKRAKCRLCIAKLDRLSRDLHFISGLMKSRVDFFACDNPHATPLTIHILAAVAEDEAKRISDRIKAALAEAKKRGTLLGSARPGHWEGREEARLAGLVKARAAAIKSKRKSSREALADILPMIRARREAGASLQTIGSELNEAGRLTARNCNWTASGVRLALLKV